VAGQQRRGANRIASRAPPQNPAAEPA
jgi:hypothetical protein